MKEETLKELLAQIDNQTKNEYPLDISIDLLTVAKQELKEMGIEYDTKLERGKEKLLIHDKGKFIYKYNKNFYHNNSKFGFKIANDKYLTERFLKFAGVPTTDSGIFNKNEYDKALNFIKSSDTIFVVKPYNLMAGIGVNLNVSKDNFEYAWHNSFTVQDDYKIENQKVIVQEQIRGFEIRLIVVEGEMLSVTLRVPAHVIGDGVSSIDELIHMKNSERKQNGYLKNRLIKKTGILSEILNQKHKSLDHILRDGELCILYPQSNMIQGGENYEITDMVSDQIKKLAVDAVKGIPGLHTAGVDIMVESLDSTEGKVLEVNKAPGFQMNYYPLIGKPQRPLKNIFSNLILEDRISKEEFDPEDVTEKELDSIIKKYKFLHEKLKTQEKIIKQLLEKKV